jgi:hypothetical protein
MGMRPGLLILMTASAPILREFVVQSLPSLLARGESTQL